MRKNPGADTQEAVCKEMIECVEKQLIERYRKQWREVVKQGMARVLRPYYRRGAGTFILDAIFASK